METKNRIVMSPMVTLSHGPEGEILDNTVNYYAERAEGGVGLIICQSGTIMRESRAPDRASVYDDRFIPGLKGIVDAVHGFTCKVAFQINHHGRQLADFLTMVSNPEEIRPVAPSPIPGLLSVVPSPETEERGSRASPIKGNTIPREATREDIHRIIQAFAEAARRIKDAGFDAVEIHAGHGYLISQFLSPLANKRTDEYGGTTENRARIACEIIEAVKKKVGRDFPVILRFSGSDFMPGDIDIEQCKQQAPLFVEAGVDALDVSASERASTHWQYPCFLFPRGPLLSLAAEIKKVVKVPVIAVGKLSDPKVANQAIAEGKADFVALGRGLLADPYWANKVRQGKLDDIRHCIYCLNCFEWIAVPENRKKGLRCAVNPGLLREREFTIKPAQHTKKVVVIGGGPAGMEAARTLAERGHSVILFEQNSHLGGQLFIACQQPQKKQDYPNILLHQERGLHKAGVEVNLGTRVDSALIAGKGLDVVIVATGASPAQLAVRGVEGPNVVQATDVILGNVTTGNKVTVVGGRSLGMEISDQLADEGKSVNLISRRAIGRGVERNVYLTLRERLIQKGVYLYPHCPVVEIRENGLYAVLEGELLFFETDTIILAVGFRSENSLSQELKGRVEEYYQIGDSLQPGNLMHAIREGAEVGRLI